MKKYIFLFSVLSIFQICSSQSLYPLIQFETTLGNITIRLYDSTTLHSNNFVKLVNDGYYNGQLFHRVIKNFMIQSGDSSSINAKSGVLLGDGGKTYRIPAEFFPSYYHKKGVLAAARESDAVNPTKASSGSQFYIVQGHVFTSQQLDFLVANGKHSPFTEEQKIIYTTLGGTPHLDNNYTVFGEVTEGMNIVELISQEPTDSNDRPLENITILKAYILQ